MTALSISPGGVEFGLAVHRATRLLIPLLIFLSPLAGESAERTGTLTYPLKHNMTLKVGTLECWVKFGFEPSEALPFKEKELFKTLLSLMSFGGEKGSVYITYLARADNMPEPIMWDVRPYPKPLMRRFGGRQKVLWKKGEWHHVAFVWKEKEMWLYLDGKSGGRVLQQGSLLDAFEVLGDKPLLLGCKDGINGRMVIDDFRLSKVDRKPEELGFVVGELKPDPYTGILDPLEGNSPKGNFVPDGKTFIQPLVILLGEGGLPSGGCSFVQGKFGKGLSLYKEDPKK